MFFLLYPHLRAILIADSPDSTPPFINKRQTRRKNEDGKWITVYHDFGNEIEFKAYDMIVADFSKIDDIIQEVWTNILIGGFHGINPVYNRIRETFIGIPKSRVRDYILNTENSQTRSAVQKGIMVCKATLIHKGKTLHVWDSKVFEEKSLKVIALFRCTQMIIYQKKAGNKK